LASYAMVKNLSQRLIIILANTCKLEFSKIFLSTHEIQHQNPSLIPLIFSFCSSCQSSRSRLLTWQRFQPTNWKWRRNIHHRSQRSSNKHVWFFQETI